MLTLDILQNLLPHGDQHVPGLIEGIATAAADVFPKYGITKDLQRFPLIVVHSVKRLDGEAL